MKFPDYDHYVTGMVVPVSALRSEESCGIGEFLDLIPFGSLCRKCGIELIQILPINDTGFQISPYSAVSAYALHPAYIRLQKLSGNIQVRKEISALRNQYAAADRVSFKEVLAEKLRIAYTIYTDSCKKLQTDSEFLEWIDANPWVKIYSVYKSVKENNDNRSWLDWEEMKAPNHTEIEEYWKKNRETVLFHAWLQFHLERQLREASETLESIRIALKGDLPILMSEDSADVWIYRLYFQMDKQAGAPPDMYSDDGQNWGFPIYNWEQLEKDNYEWWKGRLRQAGKFYHAFRIDHVLGFFRIWAVPEFEESASMGYYLPYKFIPRTTLDKNGFSEERITWLSQSHIHYDEIAGALGTEKDEVMPYLQRIEDEDLFLFNENIRGTGDINPLPVSDSGKHAMKEWIKNRTLIQVEKDTFFNTWHFVRTKAYQSLSESERTALWNIIDQAGRSSEKVWDKNGKKLLSTLRETTDMLICAEDLGVVPACVPKVLRRLGLLSLKIGFWTRKYDIPGHPFIPVKKYPYESVAALSVHDSVVFREWWESISSEEERGGFCTALKIKDISTHAYTPATAEKIIGGFFSASSCLVILQVQDFFALDGTLEGDPRMERINVPGTVSDLNWTYRLPKPIESLLQNDNLCGKVQKLTSLRRNKPLPGGRGGEKKNPV